MRDLKTGQFSWAQCIWIPHVGLNPLFISVVSQLPGLNFGKLKTKLRKLRRRKIQLEMQKLFIIQPVFPTFKNSKIALEKSEGPSQ